ARDRGSFPLECGSDGADRGISGGNVSSAVAFLIFFAASAGTWIIAPNLVDPATHGLCSVVVRRGFATVEGQLNGAVLFHRRTWRLARHHLHTEQMFQDVPLHPIHHAGEHLKGFPLVFDERVLLSIPAKTDAFAQAVDAEQVVLPKSIDGAEHYHFFEQP